MKFFLLQALELKQFINDIESGPAKKNFMQQ